MFVAHRLNDRAGSLQVRNAEYKENKEFGAGGATGGVPIRLVVSNAEADV
jgi:hypothetical protein